MVNGSCWRNSKEKGGVRRREARMPSKMFQPHLSTRIVKANHCPIHRIRRLGLGVLDRKSLRGKFRGTFAVFASPTGPFRYVLPIFRANVFPRHNGVDASPTPPSKRSGKYCEARLICLETPPARHPPAQTHPSSTAILPIRPRKGHRLYAFRSALSCASSWPARPSNSSTSTEGGGWDLAADIGSSHHAIVELSSEIMRC